MKLEIKHVAPYFPYGLKWVITNENLYEDFEFDFEEGTLDKGTIWELFLVTTKDIEFYCGECSDFAFKNNLGSEISYCGGIKPILRPLSDLNEDNARFLSSDGYMAVCEECIYVDEMHYSDVLKLIERHYDVFGLIENGLAISYNELK